MKRHSKQLLACLLALAMFATNVDAVCAAPAVTAGGNAEVQSATEGVQYTVGADGRVTMTPAGGETSGTINRV
ncbi:MAG: hypothetical protein IKO80_01935, partial [Lachnospiraceae bacterium]|nr:hypothetical protein [Lachnospiraceae bacterium]